MKKRKFSSMMAAAFAVAMAGSLGGAQVAKTAQQAPASQQRASEMKSTDPAKSTPRKQVIQHAGGLDVIQEMGGVFGMTPMQYGMRYGNGKSRKAKTNFARLSHNAKVRRR